jgi:opacity protein-like surface antigen
MNVKKRALTVVAAAIALLATAAVAAAATVTVAPGHLDGWAVDNDTCGAATTGSVAFVSGPATPPAGSGSVQFTVGANGDSYPTVRQSDYNGVKLSSLTATTSATTSSPSSPSTRRARAPSR